MSYAQDVLKLGVKMREAQKKYFKTRDRGDLVASKKLESEFDQAAAAAVKGDDLFNAGGRDNA